MGAGDEEIDPVEADKDLPSDYESAGATTHDFTEYGDPQATRELRINEDILQDRVEDRFEVIRLTWLWYYYYSTLQGMEQMRKTDQPFKLIWTVLFLAGIAFTAIGVSEVLNRYFANIVWAQVVFEEKIEQEFPAVTICNINPINCASLEKRIKHCLTNNSNCELKSRQNLCTIFYRGKCKDSFDRTNKLYFSQGSEHYRQPIVYLVNKKPRQCHSPVNYVKNDSSTDEQAVGLAMKGLTEEDEREIVHNYEDMIPHCVFKNTQAETGRPTDLNKCNEFTNSSSAHHVEGLMYCPTFNAVPEGSDQMPLVVKRSLFGRRTKLELIMNAQNELTVPLTSSVSGFRVILHEPRELPNIFFNELEVAPNSFVSFMIKKSELHWDSVSKCRTSFRGDEPYIKAKRYESDLCTQSCLLKETLTALGDDCVPPIAWSREKMIFNDSMPVCDPKRFMNQYLETQDRIDSIEQCNCVQECVAIRYEIATQTLTWPPDKEIPSVFGSANITLAGEEIREEYFNNLENSSNEDVQDFSRLVTIKEYARSNFVKISIFYDSNFVTKYDQELQYPISAIFDALGGAISLWLGMTVMSVFEIIEFVVRIIVALCTPVREDAGTDSVQEMERSTAGEQTAKSDTQSNLKTELSEQVEAQMEPEQESTPGMTQINVKLKVLESDTAEESAEAEMEAGENEDDDVEVPPMADPLTLPASEMHNEQGAHPFQQDARASENVETETEKEVVNKAPRAALPNLPAPEMDNEQVVHPFQPDARSDNFKASLTPVESKKVPNPVRKAFPPTSIPVDDRKTESNKIPTDAAGPDEHRSSRTAKAAGASDHEAYKARKEEQAKRRGLPTSRSAKAALGTAEEKQAATSRGPVEATYESDFIREELNSQKEPDALETWPTIETPSYNIDFEYPPPSQQSSEATPVRRSVRRSETGHFQTPPFLGWFENDPPRPLRRIDPLPLEVPDDDDETDEEMWLDIQSAHDLKWESPPDRTLTPPPSQSSGRISETGRIMTPSESLLSKKRPSFAPMKLVNPLARVESQLKRQRKQM